MIDPELKEHLIKIENELAQMHQKTSGMRHNLWRGVMYGVGYILGTVLIIVLIAWTLKILGYVPDFSHGVSEFRGAFSNIGKTQ